MSIRPADWGEWPNLHDLDLEAWHPDTADEYDLVDGDGCVCSDTPCVCDDSAKTQEKHDG